MTVNHVLKVYLERGVFRSRLLRAIEGQGGPYGIHRDPVSSNGIKSGSRGDEICFGTPEAYFGQEVREWIINGNLADFLALQVPKRQKRLGAAGIPASLYGRKETVGGGFQRRFAVSVFHLQALNATPIQPGGTVMPLPGNGAGSDLDRESTLWKRLARTAVRALYAFGLDLGEVVIHAGEEGRFTVEEIHPSVIYGGNRTAWLVAEAMTRILGELEKYSLQGQGIEQDQGRGGGQRPGPQVQRLGQNYAQRHEQGRVNGQDAGSGRERLIGMDPEFLLFDSRTRKVIPASRYLGRQGIAGCDVLRYRGRRLFPLAELRPEPGSEPRECLSHLMRAFRSAQSAIPDSELLWQAGGMPQRGFPLGGHLHFSGVPLTAELLRTLDNYLALPVALMEDSGSPRRRPLYGFLGDFRLQSYDEDVSGFEYRTLPSFLVSPMVTKGVVALARLIIEDMASFKERPLLENRVFHAFYSGNKEILKQKWERLAADITGAPSFSRYEEYIAPFLAAVRSGRSWDESADIRRSWKLHSDSISTLS
ncbi:hypothetical protein QYF50_25470 [Paenibacillus vini]|uniref:putative amidoligase domain-containing protein n=1 Tax=Paenibacillus vini TaxID=1476024 RepID=UPI0025B6B23B|nr:hypothetical protein [Paenibacillus vini]MDN4071247.1 hypothetical protein [Paenibacillus vini]